MINLVVGWTVLGWIAALIWAIVEQPKPESRSWTDKPIPVESEKKSDTAVHPPE